jgi:type IV pilus assembly protein PilX
MRDYADDYLNCSNRQRGVALVMALVFLLLLTMIGIAAISSTTLQEKMAGNATDKNRSMQAADSALRAGEAWIDGQASGLAFQNMQQPTIPPIWETMNWSTGGTPLTGLTRLASDPRYVLEEIDKIPDTGRMTNDYAPPPITYVHRITARGVGGTSAAVSMVQSTHEKRL